MRRFIVAYYRGLDRYYNFIFAWRKISREENFAKFHSKWILFSREENFAQNPNSRILRKLTPCEKLVLYSMRPVQGLNTQYWGGRAQHIITKPRLSPFRTYELQMELVISEKQDAIGHEFAGLIFHAHLIVIGQGENKLAKGSERMWHRRGYNNRWPTT